MSLIVADSAGFCFGVRRAVDAVYKEVEDHPDIPIYTYGPIIHNENVVDDLAKHGVRVIHSPEELNGLPHGHVLIRSHGVSAEVEEQIHSSGMDVLDLTCPFVKKIHRLARIHSEKGEVILIAGNPEHPEVQGIRGWCAGPCETVLNCDDLDNALAKYPGKTFCLLAQTTFHENNFELMVDHIKVMRYTVYVEKTICNATQERQAEARSIAASVDQMLVIGSTNSSNTRKLFEICKQECNLTHYIQSAVDLNREWFLAETRVGVTAGASTPDNIIEEVLLNVRRFWSVTERRERGHNQSGSDC